MRVAGPTIETFWGIELSKKNREEKWSPKEAEVNDVTSDDDEYRRQKLNITMVTLGKGVSKTEEQIVEVETINTDHTAHKIPLVNITSGPHNTMMTKATFGCVESVLFRLVSGDGPISLIGSVEGISECPGTTDESSLALSDWEDDSASERESDPEPPKDSGKASCKRKSPKPKTCDVPAAPKKGKKEEAKDQEKKGGKGAKGK